MPVKATTAPTSVRERVSLAVSAAAPIGSRCRRMVTDMRSSPRHRREEGDFARAGDGGVGLDVSAGDGRADHLRVLEGVRVFLAPPAEPSDQVANRRHPGRQLDVFLRLADTLAPPG